MDQMDPMNPMDPMDPINLADPIDPKDRIDPLDSMYHGLDVRCFLGQDFSPSIKKCLGRAPEFGSSPRADFSYFTSGM